MKAIHNRDIIITGLQPWDIEIGSNCKNIALEFSKHNRVLYVNSPLDFITAYKERHKPKVKKRLDVINGRVDNLIKINDNLWNFYPGKHVLPLNQLKNNTLFDFFNRINNKRFAGQIKTAIKKLGFKNYILFNDSDMFRSFYLKELLKPECYIYYTRDNLLAVKYWQVQGTRIEPLHMAKSDLVVSNSNFLARLAIKYNPESHFVGQGCDITSFKADNELKLPDDIAAIKYPVIGYIGALKALRLDISVIEHIAKAKKEWNIVLVGPEDEVFRKSNLHNLPNVHFLGPKNESELPSYLKAFDVAINPQILNEVTVGNYPRKIDEYLAMGKPSVATRTEAMEYFSDFVSLAEDKEEWVEAIGKELGNDNDNKRQSRVVFAGGHTWENNVNEIYKLIAKS
jgi:glycosyltransferase involved in cell wall biosynthesis